MGDVVSSARFQFALGKQTAEGTPQATMAYATPAYEADLSPRDERTDFEVIQGDAYRPGRYKSRAWVEGNVAFAMFPESSCAVIAAHMGLDTVTGASDPRTHTITNNNSPHWLTMYEKRPLPGASVEWDRFIDCLVKSIDIEYTAGTLPRLTAGILAKTAETKVVAPTITATDVLDAVGPWYTFVDPTLLLDLNTTPAATPVKPVSWTLHCGYDDAEFVQTTGLVGDARDLGLWTVTLEAELLLQDWTAYFATFFGGIAPAANTPLSGVITRGAMDFTLPVGPVANNDRTLQMLVPAMDFESDAPTPSPDGRGLRVPLRGKLAKPAAGQPATFVGKNARATAF